MILTATSVENSDTGIFFPRAQSVDLSNFEILRVLATRRDAIAGAGFWEPPARCRNTWVRFRGIDRAGVHLPQQVVSPSQPKSLAEV